MALDGIYKMDYSELEYVLSMSSTKTMESLGVLIHNIFSWVLGEKTKFFS